MENLKPERRGELLEAKITLRSLEPRAVLWGLPGRFPTPAARGRALWLPVRGMQGTGVEAKGLARRRWGPRRKQEALRSPPGREGRCKYLRRSP